MTRFLNGILLKPHYARFTSLSDQSVISTTGPRALFPRFSWAFIYKVVLPTMPSAILFSRSCSLSLDINAFVELLWYFLIISVMWPYPVFILAFPELQWRIIYSARTVKGPEIANITSPLAVITKRGCVIALEKTVVCDLCWTESSAVIKLLPCNVLQIDIYKKGGALCFFCGHVNSNELTCCPLYIPQLFFKTKITRPRNCVVACVRYVVEYIGYYLCLQEIKRCPAIADVCCWKKLVISVCFPYFDNTCDFTSGGGSIYNNEMRQLLIN